MKKLLKRLARQQFDDGYRLVIDHLRERARWDKFGSGPGLDYQDAMYLLRASLSDEDRDRIREIGIPPDEQVTTHPETNGRATQATAPQPEPKPKAEPMTTEKTTNGEALTSAEVMERFPQIPKKQTLYNASYSGAIDVEKQGRTSRFPINARFRDWVAQYGEAAPASQNGHAKPEPSKVEPPPALEPKPVAPEPAPQTEQPKDYPSLFGRPAIKKKTLPSVPIRADLRGEPLPCPFCGGTPAVFDDSHANQWVECEECGGHGPVTKRRGSAVRLWNDRLQPAP